ncbi:dihydroxyacetone kinase subunit L [Aureimonas sp. ME7]|uniref:dihydroxyacetone kinase subunit L n=1 Tax=Aureimonas sp. ME7 TaxID=2744252 RepID=UPI0015FCB98D|nr:dihydroxyacetone kinase subunit L [Aureimonas sp. ME7]
MSGFTARDVAALVAASHGRMATLEQELNAADAVLGDGDTGSMLARVIARMAEVPVEGDADLGASFAALAKATLSATGSSLGTLIATALMSLAKATKDRREANWSELPELLRGARDAMLARGGASLGDKTVLDGLDAVAFALEGVATPAAASEAAGWGAARAVSDFKPRPCRIGRARMFPEKSVGSDDPGMLALAKLVQASNN